MFSYNPESRILKVQKLAEPELELNLAAYQLESYSEYLTTTVHSDVKELEAAILDRLSNVSQVSITPRVGSLSRPEYQREVKKQSPRYYPVSADITIDGVTYKDVQILRIPYMDADGILNVRGARRMLLMQLVAAERISCTDGIVSVTTPHRNISLDTTKPTDIAVKYGNKKSIPLHKVLRLFNAKEHAYSNLEGLFASPYIRAALAKDREVVDATIVHELGEVRMYETYHSDAYALGKTRHALNEALSMERARGRVLSRAVAQFPAGTRVDDAVMRAIYDNRLNVVYVEAVPAIEGYRLAEVFYENRVPKGIPNCSRLRALLPQYADYAHIPEDTNVDLLIDVDVPLTLEDVLLIRDMGRKTLKCRTGTSAPPIEVTFEEEVLGNYTAPYGYLCSGPISADRSFDEWVCYYDNPTLEKRDDTYLNVHDIAALYSLCVNIRQHPEENFLLDKDQGLLKKVLAANELFSNALRAVIPEFIRKVRNKLAANLQANMIESKTFYGLTNDWIKYLWDNHQLVSADTINPIAQVAQANHLVSNLRKGAIPEKLRLLSMGYYGRICPYETPAGQKLGVTNTKAIGAKIVDGILTTPYRRVLKNELGVIVGISDEVTYMDAQEEARYRIGDSLSLKKDGYNYINNKVMARIPAPNNQVTAESVDAFSLDYVNAYCEQHLSPTAALIPFAGSDDAVRVTYATNMLKQSVLVQGAQAPRVMTSMYRNLFNHSNAFTIRARMDGEVYAIPQKKLQLTYYGENGEEIEEDIPIDETLVTGRSVNYLNFHVKPGDKFKKGDVLVDSGFTREGIYAPGVNLFAAYLPDGYEYEDAVLLSDYAADQLVSIGTETVKFSVQAGPAESYRVGNEYCYQYIPEHGTVTKVKRFQHGDVRRQTSTAIDSGLKSGILYRIERDEASEGNDYSAHLLSFNRLHTGDKLAGRHSNKGTASCIRKNSEMPCFANGRQLDILLNPCGVPSRMNIGQMFEAYLGFIATLLDIYVESDPFNGATRGDIKLLMRYVWDLANSADARAVCAKYPMLPSLLHERAKERHAAIREWEGCFNPDGTAYLWNPATGKYLENPVTFGVPYMLKLEHMVDHKMHSRAGMLEEEYSLISKQPTSGAAKGGGQRMGEMELCNLAAYGASEFLEETCNASSDNVLARTNSTLRTLNLMEYAESGVLTPHAVEMWRYFLEVLGYKVTAPRDILPPIDAAFAECREVPSVRGLLSRPPEKATTQLFDSLRGEFG